MVCDRDMERHEYPSRPAHPGGSSSVFPLIEDRTCKSRVPSTIASSMLSDSVYNMRASASPTGAPSCWKHSWPDAVNSGEVVRGTPAPHGWTSISATAPLVFFVSLAG